MLVPFPIAFFVATLLCDLAFWRTGNGGWVMGSVWLLSAGLVLAALAAVVGLIDVIGEPRIRALREVWFHAGGNVLLVLIELFNLIRRANDGAAAILPTGLFLSAVAVGLMLFTGWLGWQMVYRDHVGIADVPDSQGHIGAHHAN
jgi:uncharacterized membrane protein